MSTDWNLVFLIGLWIFLFFQFAIMIYFIKQGIYFLNQFNVSMFDKKSIRIGNHAPLFHLDDESTHLNSMNISNGKHTLLLFRSATCPTYSAMMTDVAHLNQQFEANLFIVTQEKLEEESCPNIPNSSYIVAPELFELYYIKKVPTIFIIDPEGYVVATGDLNELDNVIRLVPKRKAGSIAQ